MRGAVGRLSPGIARVVEYHLGWVDGDGRAGESPSGKAVRPALVFSSARAAGADPEVAVPGAVAVEFIHDFSLLHDDVMDGDTERRHRPAAWSLFGVGRAILAGDALLASAHGLLTLEPTPERLRASNALSEATAAMITGQAEDLDFESRVDVTVEECVAMSGNKTAALMSCACRVGAILGGAEAPTVAALAAFGRSIGLSFQAVDDVLGIWGDPEVTGKPAWNDLRQRKKTLPVVAAIEAGGEAGARLTEILSSEALDEGEIARAVELVEINGGRARAEKEAGLYLAEAMSVLDGLSLPGAAKADLRAIARFITARDS